MPDFKIRLREIAKLKKLFTIDPKLEVMAIGLIDIAPKTLDVTLEDIFIPTQEVTSTSCDIEPPEDLAALYHDMVTQDLSIDKTRCWIHLHPNGMGASPSGTDTSQQNYFLKDMNMDFSFMLIFDEDFPFGDVTCEVWFKSANDMFGDSLIKRDYTLTLDDDNLEIYATEADIKEVEKLYDDRVKEKTYTASSFNYNASNFGRSSEFSYCAKVTVTKDAIDADDDFTRVHGSENITYVEYYFNLTESAPWVDAKDECSDIEDLISGDIEKYLDVGVIKDPLDTHCANLKVDVTPSLVSMIPKSVTVEDFPAPYFLVATPILKKRWVGKGKKKAFVDVIGEPVKYPIYTDTDEAAAEEVNDAYFDCEGMEADGFTYSLVNDKNEIILDHTEVAGLIYAVKVPAI